MHKKDESQNSQFVQNDNEKIALFFEKGIDKSLSIVYNRSCNQGKHFPINNERGTYYDCL